MHFNGWMPPFLRGLFMKTIFAVMSVLALSGCAGGDWYKAENTSSTARLRVIALAPSNTEFATKQNPSCDTEEWHILGWFHPSAGSLQAGRRGFDRRVGMPLSSEYPDNMFAEHIIDASKPINVFVSGVYHKGPTIYEVGLCRMVATFTPQPNHDYEVLYTGTGSECDLKLFELTASDGQTPKRIETKFENDVLSCSK